MCMKPIRHVDVLVKRVLDVSGFNGISYRRMWSRGQDAGESPEWLATHSFLGDGEVYGGMLRSDSLREIHLKTCLARIVMYSQRHVC